MSHLSNGRTGVGEWCCAALAGMPIVGEVARPALARYFVVQSREPRRLSPCESLQVG
jgi:hypothetical protein